MLMLNITRTISRPYEMQKNNYREIFVCLLINVCKLVFPHRKEAGSRKIGDIGLFITLVPKVL